MSAIFGIFHLDGKPLSLPYLNDMSLTLAHRGRDGEGIWNEGAVGLGHRMLWTTPESLHEQLPQENLTGNIVITADARIDNRDELIDILHIDRRPPEEITDSELILAAYEKWGEQCSEKLLGDFVFAIWDSRNQTLFCARDPLGVKHFYYYCRPGHIFAIASEIKALLCLPVVPRELNELAVADHLMPLYEDKASTFYKNVLRLPSAHSMTVSRDGLRVLRYYSPDLSRELRLRSNGEYAEAFREIFFNAVRCRLRSAYPVASMLSGGLDSSSISCVAAKLLAQEGRGQLLTFSGVWPSMADVDPKSDECQYMNAAIAMGGFEAHFVHADRLSPLTDWEKMLWHQDVPLSAPNMYLDWALFKAANEQGARVLLGGTDGDTIVSYGYEDLSELARRLRWFRLIKEARSLSKNMPYRAHRFKKLVWDWAVKPIVPEYVKQCWRVLRGKPRVTDKASRQTYWRNRPINQDFAERIGISQRFWDFHDAAYPQGAKAREWHWGGIQYGGWSYIMESFQKAAGAFSLETRYPFFDRKLIEFCLALPPGQKIQNGWTRSILRRAMEGILPKEIQWRQGKGHLSAGVNINLLQRERATLEDAVFENSDLLREYVDLPSLHAIYRKYEQAPMGNNDDPFTLMLVVNLSLWLRQSGLIGSAKPGEAIAVSC